MVPRATGAALTTWLITSAGGLCFTVGNQDKADWRLRVWRYLSARCYWRNVVQVKLRGEGVNIKVDAKRKDNKSSCSTPRWSVHRRQVDVHQWHAASLPCWRPVSISSSLCAMDRTSIFIWEDQGGQAGEMGKDLKGDGLGKWRWTAGEEKLAKSEDGECEYEGVRIGEKQRGENGQVGNEGSSRKQWGRKRAEER